MGFIRKLPHLLVEAFKSTLEETALADLLIEVVDATGRAIDQQQATTREVLAELGAADKPTITVFNKIDLLADPLDLRRLRLHHPDALFVSTLTGAGLAELAERLGEAVSGGLHRAALVVPHRRYDLMARLHAGATILAETYEEDGVHVDALLPPDLYAAARDFVTPPPPDPVDSLEGTC